MDRWCRRCERTGYEEIPIRANGQAIAKLSWPGVGGVNPAAVEGRSVCLHSSIERSCFVPQRATVLLRSEQSADAVVDCSQETGRFLLRQ